MFSCTVITQWVIAPVHLEAWKKKSSSLWYRLDGNPPYTCLMKSCLILFKQHVPFDSIPQALLSCVLDAGNINIRKMWFMSSWSSRFGSRERLVDTLASAMKWLWEQTGCIDGGMRDCKTGGGEGNNIWGGFRKRRWNKWLWQGYVSPGREQQCKVTVAQSRLALCRWGRVHGGYRVPDRKGGWKIQWERPRMG